MVRTRKIETKEERNDRLKKDGEKLHEADRAESDSLDAMVRKSIRLHGA